MERAALQFPAERLLKAQGVRALLLDVDGVLTDGSQPVSEQGESILHFHRQDGHGMRLLQAAGIQIVVITGRDSPALRTRLQALDVRHACFGVADKAEAARTVLAGLGLDWPDCAVIGDDWPDLALVTRCAFSAAPPQAHAELLARVDYVCQRAAGQGAVREVCDLLLVAAGRYQTLLLEALA